MTKRRYIQQADGSLKEWQDLNKIQLAFDQGTVSDLTAVMDRINLEIAKGSIDYKTWDFKKGSHKEIREDFYQEMLRIISKYPSVVCIDTTDKKE